jgi:hypothetical protein
MTTGCFCMTFCSGQVCEVRILERSLHSKFAARPSLLIQGPELTELKKQGSPT